MRSAKIGKAAITQRSKSDIQAAWDSPKDLVCLFRNAFLIKDDAIKGHFAHRSRIKHKALTEERERAC
jgi:hypothetical protein